MQKVELYYDSFVAMNKMNDHIKEGWRIVACTMGIIPAGSDRVLVVYER